MRATQSTEVITHHGEGAGWDAVRGCTTIVDMLAGDLVDILDDGTVNRRNVGSVAAAWRPRAHGGYVVATEHGFSILDHTGALETSVAAFDDPTMRMNEGGCDPLGRFVCGSMRYDVSPGAGVMWRLDPDLSVHRVHEGFTVPNGLVWSSDGTTAYHADTPTGRIDGWSYDLATGAFSEPRPIATVTVGAPDGMTIDEEGGLWVALWEGHAVHRYDLDGRLTEVVEVDAAQVTSCAFTGDNLDTLVVTTSRQGIDAQEDPLAGAVFTAQPGVRGRPAQSFRG